MAEFGASIDDIKIHSSLVSQDERVGDVLATSLDDWRLNAATYGMMLFGGELNSDVEVFLRKKE